jgi:hypothetical protein
VDVIGKRKISYPCHESNCNSTAFQPTIAYSLYRPS